MHNSLRYQQEEKVQTMYSRLRRLSYVYQEYLWHSALKHFIFYYILNVAVYNMEVLTRCLLSDSGFQYFWSVDILKTSFSWGLQSGFPGKGANDQARPKFPPAGKTEGTPASTPPDFQRQTVDTCMVNKMVIKEIRPRRRFSPLLARQ